MVTSAAIGVLAACAIAASLIRVSRAVRQQAGHDAYREAELDDWSYDLRE